MGKWQAKYLQAIFDIIGYCIKLYKYVTFSCYLFCIHYYYHSFIYKLITASRFVYCKAQFSNQDVNFEHTPGWACILFKHGFYPFKQVLYHENKTILTVYI